MRNKPGIQPLESVSICVHLWFSSASVRLSSREFCLSFEVGG
jgi:hypothetical protein